MVIARSASSWGSPSRTGQAGAHPQILQGDDRVIGDDADGGARPAHDARVGGGQLPQLRLGTIAEQGTAQHRHPVLGQQGRAQRWASVP